MNPQNLLNGYNVLGKTGMVIQPASGATAVLYDSTKESTARGMLSSSHQGARWKAIIVNLNSSHDSAANGLEISESDDDGAHWDITYKHSYVAATDVRFKIGYFLVSAPDVRVRYINSANVLTLFRWSVLGDSFERAVWGVYP